jgi:hypothetical protein
MIERRDKAAKTNPKNTLMILGIVVVLGGIGSIFYAKWTKDNPIYNATNAATPDQYLVGKVDPTVNPELSTHMNSNDPDFNVYQAWQEAKALSRDDLNGALAKCEETIRMSPDLAGDAYFTMAQCMEYSMEVPIRHLPEPLISRAEAEMRWNREFDYYQKAIDAYGQPGARSLLGITRDPNEQLRKIRDVIIDDKKKIMTWWLEKLK